MNNKEFNKHVNERIKRTKQLLLTKGQEYAGQDRLSNFKEAAAFRHKTPEAVLWDYVTKHIMALNSFVNRYENENDESISIAQWGEKLGDIIAYMHLLEALLKERHYGD